MMENKVLIINGNNFSDLESFYVEIDRVFTKDLNFKTGHNLDAFNDILRGGFGVYDYEERIKFVWINFQKSELDLGEGLMSTVIEIINSHEHIEFSTIS